MLTLTKKIPMKNLFLLDNNITFLNFGSFGACPKVVFDDYIQWQYLLEKEPVQFIAFDGIGYVKHALSALATYINCNANDLVFVPNPSHAINLLAKTIKLAAGDEVLSTNLEYGAMDRTWNYYCKAAGAKYIQQPISLPLTSKEAFIEEFWKGYSAKTKVVFISQITSSTALIFPVKEICEEAKKRGLITIVDGAHVPAHIELDLSQLQADFYTGACHKWMMTPKGCSFLYAKPEFQAMLDPLIISWGYQSAAPSNSQFFDYHQFNGTRDFSAYLTVPKALSFMEQHDWKKVSAQCKNNVLAVAPKLFELLNTKPLAPLTNEFFGQMCSAEIKTFEPEKLQRLLFEKYRIEIPVMRHADKCYIRFSFQAFNTVAEIDYLVQSLAEIKKETNLL
jgi:isopenicillin-N epimerase